MIFGALNLRVLGKIAAFLLPELIGVVLVKTTAGLARALWVVFIPLRGTRLRDRVVTRLAPREQAVGAAFLAIEVVSCGGVLFAAFCAAP